MNAQKIGLSLTALLLAVGTSARAQGILPADGPEPVSGANPFQGLGRPDDPGPNRLDPPEKTATETAPASTEEKADKGDKAETADSKDEKVQSAQEIAEEEEKKQAEEERNREEKRKAADAEKAKEDAEHHGRHHVANDPHDPLRIAMHLLHARQYDRCLEAVGKVLETSPNYPQAHYIRAVAYVMTRQYTKAAEEYRAVLKLVPSGKLNQLANEGLRKINF